MGGLVSRQDVGNAEELAEKWRADLASWAIPQHILDQAVAPPWVHPVAMFTVDEHIADNHSHQIARAALPSGGSVLDVGCGGGRAAFALVPPAGTVVGVDHQQAMLDEFAAAAEARGVVHHQYLGNWQEIAEDVPIEDVVVCHHVAFNVPDVIPFLTSLDQHAKNRVVLELPMTHPMSNMNALWKKFWDLDRPTQPRADDLAAIATAMGFDAHLDVWEDETWGKRVEMPEAERVKFARIRLCLSEDRDAEVAAALLEQQDAQPRTVATLWWDKK